MEEQFAVPCVGAIIEKAAEGKRFLLLQTRQKPDGGETNGLLEIPAGKVRAYESLFDALYREVWEETGLQVTAIGGEERSDSLCLPQGEVCTAEPFCVTQNLSGAYPILLHTFCCQAEGNPVSVSKESCDIDWMDTETLERLLREQPERFFFLHVPALRKYLMRK